ncbi:restriction endonuclease subunit S [Streptococcus halotolerans]|uniref:restriction endonuclease subunit S n=1 Tax=Streptococcus halotolerans TaxID=1814128 RepID=UPI0007893973|nr:restriction endonuclease subunit S [Streptococcus halotolerans]
MERVSQTSGKAGLPRVEYEDIISGQGQLNKNIYLKSSNKKGILFEVGDILFGKLRPYLKNWLLADFRGIAVGDWWVLRSSKVSQQYIYTLIQTSKYQTVSNLSTGTKMPRSDWSQVSTADFFFPKFQEEQTTIGTFFSTLDSLITLHQREYQPNFIYGGKKC